MIVALTSRYSTTKPHKANNTSIASADKHCIVVETPPPTLADTSGVVVGVVVVVVVVVVAVVVVAVVVLVLVLVLVMVLVVHVGPCSIFTVSSTLAKSFLIKCTRAGSLASRMSVTQFCHCSFRPAQAASASHLVILSGKPGKATP